MTLIPTHPHHLRRHLRRPGRTTRAASLLAAALSTALLLTACGSGGSGDDDGDEPSAASSSAAAIPDDADFNAADVAFATDMAQHHAQALAMVDLTADRTLDPEFAALAEQIRAAQTPEIETMAGWLQDWGQPVPATVEDHGSSASGSSAGAMGDMDMPGMMSAQDMTELAQASDADFESAWLTMMIAHHEGAVTMARTEIDDGEDADAVALAEEIVASQSTEIDQMKAMLAGR